MIKVRIDIATVNYGAGLSYDGNGGHSNGIRGDRVGYGVIDGDGSGAGLSPGYPVGNGGVVFNLLFLKSRAVGKSTSLLNEQILITSTLVIE